MCPVQTTTLGILLLPLTPTGAELPPEAFARLRSNLETILATKAAAPPSSLPALLQSVAAAVVPPGSAPQEQQAPQAAAMTLA